MLKIAVVVSLTLACVQGIVLPSYFPKCQKNAENQDICLRDSANAGLPIFSKGDPDVHVVPMNPLHIDNININIDGNLKINLTNCDLNGWDTAVFEKFRWDWENKKISLEAKTAKANFIGNYDISGRILILPIKGQGPCNVTFVNVLFSMEFDYEIEERKGKEYINIVDGRISYAADRIYWKLENLFGGDPKLGSEMNKFLDENWKEVNGEISAGVGDALAKVFQSILKSFFGRVPISLLWD